MKAVILLNHTEDIKKIEEEEKARFLKEILVQMGVPIQEIWSDDVLSVSQRMQMRHVLAVYGVKVLDSHDGFLQIYVEGEKVASFEKPIYKLKRDLKEINPKKQLYLEMEINCWSLFEESGN